MKTYLLTALIAITVLAGCKKERPEKECSTITAVGYKTTPTNSANWYFTLSNGTRVKTYVNTKDAYQIGSEICYRPDEVYKD